MSKSVRLAAKTAFAVQNLAFELYSAGCPSYSDFMELVTMTMLLLRQVDFTLPVPLEKWEEHFEGYFKKAAQDDQAI